MQVYGFGIPLSWFVLRTFKPIPGRCLSEKYVQQSGFQPENPTDNAGAFAVKLLLHVMAELEGFEPPRHITMS